MDIIKRKKDALLADLSSADKTEVDEELYTFANELSKASDPQHVIAYLLTHGFYGAFSKSSYKSLIQSKSKSSAKSTESDVNASNSERLFIALGKTDGIDEQMLIDFLYDETNIEKESFSEIKIFDTFSLLLFQQIRQKLFSRFSGEKNEGNVLLLNVLKAKTP